MPTERLLIFDEAGNAKRVKARLTRFLENEPVTNTEKAAIRSTLSVPASAEGLTPANNLSDVSSAATSRTNLDVNSIAQDAEANGTKLVGPSMHFDGSAYVTITSDSKLSFEGSGDDLPFTFSCWTKLPASSPAGTVFFSKWISASEYSFQTTSSGNLILYLSDGSNTPFVKASTALPTEQWIHVCGTYSGTTGGAFSTAANGLTLYVNGEAVTATQTNKPAYTGMTAGSDALQISRIATTNYEQSIRDARIFNKALTASEVKALCLSGSLPESFAESTGGNQVYSGDSSTFTGGLGNWTEQGSTAITVAASGGKLVVTNTASTSGTRGAVNVADGDIAGKKYRLTFSSQVASGTGQSCRVRSYNLGAFASISNLKNGTDSGGFFYFTPSGTETVHSFEFVGQATSGSEYILIDLQPNTGAGEVYNFDSITLTQIGSVLDARAEQFDTSTGKLYDLSGNDFVGTQSGGVQILGRQSPIYETGTWTVGLEFGGTALAVASQTGTWTRIGDLVHIAGAFNLSSIAGIGSGDARITGLPFTAEAQTSRHGITFVLTVGMTGLTSAVVGNVLGGDTDIAIYQWGSTGTASLTNANFTASTYSRFSGFYQIS